MTRTESLAGNLVMMIFMSLSMDVLAASKGEAMNSILVKKEIPKYKGYESASYAVEERSGSIEIRAYESALLAEVEVYGKRDVAINEGFRILAGYIFGNNFSKEKIAMTTPVGQSKVGETIAMTSPVNQSATDYGWMVRFMMPSKYSLETLPKPRDQRIKFRITQPVKKVVIRFSGFISEKNIKQHVLRLNEYIKEHSLMVRGEPQYMFYDAPWTLPFMRRNEISFVLDKESEI